jgi:hypothetical protein
LEDSHKFCEVGLWEVIMRAASTGRITRKPLTIQRASAGRQFSGRATLEEAEPVGHERKPSEQFPGACLKITSGLPTILQVDGDNRVLRGLMVTRGPIIAISNDKSSCGQ